jgi:hypothetical protein
MFTLIHPAKVRGSRPIFHVRDDQTGQYILNPETGRDFYWSRKDAEELQRKLNDERKQKLAA